MTVTDTRQNVYAIPGGVAVQVAGQNFTLSTLEARTLSGSLFSAAQDSEKLSALRAVQHPAWLWVPGMRRIGGGEGWRLLNNHMWVSDDGLFHGPGITPPSHAFSQGLPDFDDEATLACFLRLVNKAVGEAFYVRSHIPATPNTHPWHIVLRASTGTQVSHAPSEGEAILLALEALTSEKKK